MRLKLREIPSAYIGRHCEVVGPLGVRVYPGDNRKPVPGTDRIVNLGTDRGSCEGFLAGYRFAREEQK